MTMRARAGRLVLAALAAGEELLVPRPDVASINLTGSIFDEDHWIIYCPQLSGFDAYTIFPVGDPPPTPVIQQMIFDAYDQTPVLAFNPITSPDGDEDIFLITQAITFLWVDDIAWDTPVHATVTLPLPIAPFSVTTTAVAREAHWSGGDEPTWCSGDDMHPYDFGIGNDEDQPSDCFMIYKRSSAVQDNTVDLEVVWDVAYACSNGACGGPLPDITTISSRRLLVPRLTSSPSGSGPAVYWPRLAHCLRTTSHGSGRTPRGTSIRAGWRASMAADRTRWNSSGLSARCPAIPKAWARATMSGLVSSVP